MKPLFCILPFFLLVGRCATAGIVYDVTLDTASLVSSAAGPFSLGFELAQGSQVDNNSAVISGFKFGAGSPFGPPTITLGSASGNLSTSVSLSDNAAVSFFAQQFSAGSTLSFSVNLGTTVSPGQTPDTFVIYLLDSSNSPIPTLAGAGADYLLILNAASDPNLQTFNGDTSRNPVAGGAPVSFSVTATAVAPEPHTAGLVSLAILISLIVRLWRSGRGFLL